MGRDLIQAAELRQITSSVNSYNTAVNTFRTKYNCLPGDCPHATDFWGEAAPGAACDDTSNGIATCNGDDDGFIEITTTNSDEAFRFWQQLSNAELIAGSYTGVKSPIGHTWGAQAGENVPQEYSENGGFFILDRSYVGGWYNDIFPPRGNNWYEFGLESTNSAMQGSIISAQDAWKIDSKMDDGKPGTGIITTFNNSRKPNCADGDVATTAAYQTTNTSIGCVLLFSMQ